MGIILSTTHTSPFSFATGIIGIVSFCFTLGVFFKVVWVNLETLGEADHEVHAYLTTLRTELLEERASLKVMRKGMRKHQKWLRKEDRNNTTGIELDEVSLKTMNDTVRHLIRQFNELEKPFLEEGERGIGDAPNHRTRTRRRNSSVSPPGYGHGAYNSPPEKAHSRAGNDHDRKNQVDEEAEDEAYWAQRTKYASFTFGRRFQWLTRKARAQTLFDNLSRLQIRRTARQVAGISMMLREYGSGTMELNEAVTRIDERVSRVVGVRRVE